MNPTSWKALTVNRIHQNRLNPLLLSTRHLRHAHHIPPEPLIPLHLILGRPEPHLSRPHKHTLDRHLLVLRRTGHPLFPGPDSGGAGGGDEAAVEEDGGCAVGADEGLNERVPGDAVLDLGAEEDREGEKAALEEYTAEREVGEGREA